MADRTAERTADILKRMDLPALNGQSAPQKNPPPSAARPDGCWCGGTGGRTAALATIWVPRPAGLPPIPGVPADPKGEPVIDVEHRRVWLETCPACPEGEGAADYRETVYTAVRQQAERHFQDGWRRTGVPGDFLGRRLTDHPLRKTKPKLIAAMMPPKLGAPDYEAKRAFWLGWWYLWGKHGAGKTGAAVGYLWEFYQHERRMVRFVTMKGLLNEIKATYNAGESDEAKELRQTEHRVVEFYCTIPCLAIDDYADGRDEATAWAEERLGLIIDYRHANSEEKGLTTVFTSNYDLESTGSRVSERLMWRIHERVKGRNWQVDGPNLRL